MTEEEQLLALLRRATPAQLRVAKYAVDHPTLAEKEIEKPTKHFSITAPMIHKSKPSEHKHYSGKGRIKCCNKFRSPTNHWSHMRSAHKGCTEEEVRELNNTSPAREVNAKKRKVTNYKDQNVLSLSVEQISKLLELLGAS